MKLALKTPIIALRLLAFSTIAMLYSQSALAGATVDRMPIVTMGSGEAKLVRNDNQLSVSGRATDLIPGNTYTVWWIVTDSSGLVVINATGGIANAAGEFGFGGALQTGDYEPGETTPRFVLVGGSLVDPLNATVVLHVVDHGPPMPGSIPAQISEISPAGCPVGCKLHTEMIFAP